MNPVTGHIPVKQIDKLRAVHQSAAKLAAATGRIPPSFSSDPTFQELILDHSRPSLEAESSLLVGVKSDKLVNSSD